MARLPATFRAKNRTTKRYRELYARLPARIRELVRLQCLVFDNDPAHRSLRRHQLEDTKKGQHEPGSWSVSITMQYRAIYIVGSDGRNVWYWIGTHADYDAFSGNI